jgi:vacuolar-type H+-ATPase subunit E/Vma4
MASKTIKKGVFGDSKNISNKIILEAEREAETIIENAKRQAEEIINKAKKDAEEMINKEVKVAYETIKMEEKRRITEINLKIREMMLHEMERIFNEILNEVKKRFHEVKKTAAYASFLQELILEGCEAVGSEKLIIKIDSKDKDVNINIEEFKNMIEERIRERKVEIESIQISPLATEDLFEFVSSGIESLEEGMAKPLKIKCPFCDSEFNINIEEFKNMIEERIRERKVEVSIIFDNISEVGGVLVSTPDGNIVYDNTLEAILERNASEIKKIITRSISEGEGELPWALH